MVWYAVPIQISAAPLHPAANVESEKHLVEKIVREKEVGKEAARVSALPAVPADLFCFFALFYFIQDNSEFTQLGAVLKSKEEFFSPKVLA